MGSVNKVILVGNLGQNVELKYTPGGAAVANFSIATSETWRDKEGEKQERTDWHKIVLWGKQAESLQQYLLKGRQIYVEGRLQTRKWDDKDGNTKYMTEVRAHQVVLLGRRDDTAGSGPHPDRQEQQTPTMSGAAPTPELTDDDIPF